MIETIKFTLDDIATPNAAISREDVMEVLESVTEDQCRRVLKYVPYNAFLHTPYWKCVRVIALQRAGHKCQACSETQNLQIHHNSYANRGAEYWNRNDLMVSCAVCHARLHRQPVVVITKKQAKRKKKAKKAWLMARRAQEQMKAAAQYHNEKVQWKSWGQNERWRR